MWSQVYDPFNNVWLSTMAAAIPVVIMLAALAFFHIKAHIAALMGLVSALVVAIFGFTMPADTAVSAALYGAGYGLFPIGWIILNVIFLYQLTERKGQFTVLRESIAGISGDRRLQLLLIAFSFGAFFEGAGGFGTPVAVTGAMLIGLGFAPLAASGLSLIANTAPVAYGALGTPIIALAGVTGLDMLELSGMVGRQLPLFSLIVPFWLVWAFCGFRRMLQIWPAVLVAGAAFAIPQYLISNLHGPWLVDVGAAVSSMLCLTLFLKVWKPKEIMTSASGNFEDGSQQVAVADAGHGYTTKEVMKAWTPWLILSVIVLLWGIPEWKKKVMLEKV
jgi:lactate permease